MPLALVWFLVLPIVATELPWIQWGGPARNFSLSDVAIGATEQAPRLLWRRELGTDGFAGIAAEGDRVFTAFRKGVKECVAALSAATGEVVWTFENGQPLRRAAARAQRA